LELRRDLLDEGVVRKAKCKGNCTADGVIKRITVRVEESRALSCAAFLQLYLLYDSFDSIHRNRVLEAVQNVVRRVL
jgi:hypothetical protein